MSHDLATARTEIVALYDQLFAAYSTKEDSVVAAILHRDFHSIDPTGDLRDREQYLWIVREMFGPDYRATSYNVDLRLFGNIAVVSAINVLDGQYENGYAVWHDIRVTGVWIFEDERWQFFSQQGSYPPGRFNPEELRRD